MIIKSYVMKTHLASTNSKLLLFLTSILHLLVKLLLVSPSNLIVRTKCVQKIFLFEEKHRSSKSVRHFRHSRRLRQLMW